jgi:hypothetical protein
MQCKSAILMQRSVNFANHGLLEFNLVRGLGAGHSEHMQDGLNMKLPLSGGTSSLVIRNPFRV